MTDDDPSLNRALCIAEITRLSEQGASFWCSVELAAVCGEARTVLINCSKIIGVTREIIELAKALNDGEPP